MTTCKRQRCDREAETARVAQGQCILHAQKSLRKPAPVEETEEQEEPPGAPEDA